MSKFQVGDQVWVARFDKGKAIQVPCTVCNGNRKVILILGNGDEVELPCDYCGKGNLGVPTGYEIEYHPYSDPESIIIDGTTINTTLKGEQVEYWSGTKSCHRIYHNDDLFKSYEEAKKRGEEKKEEWLRAEMTQAYLIKANIHKSFAWNAGYHLRAIKRLEKDIKYHKSKAILCQKRSKN